MSKNDKNNIVIYVFENLEIENLETNYSLV